MEPPPSTISRVLLLKIIMFVFLLASLISLVTDTAYVPPSLFTEPEIHYNDIYTYRYVLATIIIGLIYSLLQIGFSIYHLSTGNRRIAGDRGFLFDFYGDKVISFFIATGSAAGFGATRELKATADTAKLLLDDYFSIAYGHELDDYFNKAYASASLLLFAFLCAAILSVSSSYDLPKVINQGNALKTEPNRSIEREIDNSSGSIKQVIKLAEP